MGNVLLGESIGQGLWGESMWESTGASHSDIDLDLNRGNVIYSIVDYHGNTINVLRSVSLFVDILMNVHYCCTCNVMYVQEKKWSPVCGRQVSRVTPATA